MKNRLLTGIIVVAVVGVSGYVLLCQAEDAPNSTPLPLNTPRTVHLAPYRDPWTMARPRWWDIAGRTFNDFIQHGFSYGRSQVELTYDADPANGQFTGHLVAAGLKPNFAYQLKLIGKPDGGRRGWGKWGDELGNVRLGSVARWWCDTCLKNVTDSHYKYYGPHGWSHQRHSIYGYAFLGTFVTSPLGAADVWFRGDRALHITWRSDQKGYKHVLLGDFTLQSDPRSNYGYGQPVPSRKVRLYYEWQEGRSHVLRFKPGAYNLRFVITEESFHNLFGTSTNSRGGYWMTVLANEDFDANGQPDTNPENDIRFTVK